MRYWKSITLIIGVNVRDFVSNITINLPKKIRLLFGKIHFSKESNLKNLFLEIETFRRIAKLHI
jgi:hypothetical protein